MVDALDSKSISRKGSRGSSPRPGTTSSGTDRATSALARALLPVLLHELNNHTQYLAALGALQGPEPSLPDRGAGLARTADEVEELGWLLGLCAFGHGTDLLRDRSERDGLGPLVRFVRKALRRAGRDLERADRALPALSPRVGAEGAWRAGELLHACALARTEPLAWELDADGDDLVLTCRVPVAALDDGLRAEAIVDERAPDAVSFRIAGGGAS